MPSIEPLRIQFMGKVSLPVLRFMVPLCRANLKWVWAPVETNGSLPTRGRHVLKFIQLVTTLYWVSGSSVWACVDIIATSTSRCYQQGLIICTCPSRSPVFLALIFCQGLYYCLGANLSLVPGTVDAGYVVYQEKPHTSLHSPSCSCAFICSCKYSNTSQIHDLC